MKRIAATPPSFSTSQISLIVPAPIARGAVPNIPARSRHTINVWVFCAAPAPAVNARKSASTLDI